jgi:hypothetical protein
MRAPPKACIPAREVVVRLRPRKSKRIHHDVSVIIPWRWSKSRFLSYCRACHPTETVMIQVWGDVIQRNGSTRYWMPNPEELVKPL